MLKKHIIKWENIKVHKNHFQIIHHLLNRFVIIHKITIKLQNIKNIEKIKKAKIIYDLVLLHNLLSKNNDDHIWEYISNIFNNVLYDMVKQVYILNIYFFQEYGIFHLYFNPLYLIMIHSVTLSLHLHQVVLLKNQLIWYNKTLQE